ncbi:MAG: VOC family protein [Planctomycetes bacterium]|nr:VOC family protein [Planctomycetota bacterium]MBI3844736.1 VOC family protein [Planctomycetota bacterium]
MLKRITSVSYETRDLGGAIEWYTKVLGLKLRFRKGDWAEFETGGAALALHQTRGGSPPGGPSNATAIFEVDDVRSVRAILGERGVVCIGEIQDVGGAGWLTSFRDPEGNVFDLWQPRRSAKPRTRKARRASSRR